MSLMDTLKQSDPEIAKEIDLELNRQRTKLELIASENIVSKAVMEAQGSVLTNKYAEGYPGKRYYGGCEYVDVVEQLAIDRAKKLFGAAYANVQPHSGAQANMAVFFSLLTPGDTVMGMNLTDGGHLTHGSPVNMSGKYFKIVPYGVDKETERIDYDALEKQAEECKPKLIVALIPMAVLFLLFNIWKLNINICLLCSIALSLVLFWPQLRRRDLKAMLNSGAVDSVPMTMTVAAICGFAGVITNTDAFQSMITAITSISIAPILICWVVVALMCMLTGGSSTGQLVALPIIAPKLQELGLTASTIHRVSAFAATTLDSMPYSGSILMLLPMCHMKLKEVYPALFVTTVIATTVGTAAVTLMCVLFPGLA